MSKARCKNCGDVVESKTRHDFVTCTCFQETRATVQAMEGENPGATHRELVALASGIQRGFYLDGGKDYTKVGGNFTDIEWLEE